MNCSDFKKEMNNFIHDTIKEDVVEDFIKHYRTCPQCNEELEIYYMINMTFNDNAVSEDMVEMSNSFDFKKRLSLKIANYQEKFYQKYKNKFIMRFILCGTEFVAFVMAVYFIIFFLGGNNGL